MSRFAVIHEDPDYDDDLSWAEEEAEWEDYVAEKQHTDAYESIEN